jgi:hypothetical protein
MGSLQKRSRHALDFFKRVWGLCFLVYKPMLNPVFEFGRLDPNPHLNGQKSSKKKKNVF